MGSLIFIFIFLIFVLYVLDNIVQEYVEIEFKCH